jgi:2-polyprenyl-3-methyl-5-hydroxy-6-metoxy-1,4-benzoquinol methylase
MCDTEDVAVRMALSWLPPGTAMDVGSEGGRVSRMLAAAGWSLTCIDINADTLAVCQSRLPAAKCILVSENATTLPAADHSMNMIVCLEVWPVMDADWFLPEAFRILKPNGLLVGAVMNRTSLRGVFVRARERRTVQPGDTVPYPHWYNHYRHSYATWKRDWLERTGFRVRYERGYCWFPVRRQGDSRLVPVLTSIEKALLLPHIPSLSPYIVFIAEKP